MGQMFDAPVAEAKVHGTADRRSGCSSSINPAACTRYHRLLWVLAVIATPAQFGGICRAAGRGRSRRARLGQAEWKVYLDDEQLLVLAFTVKIIVLASALNLPTMVTVSP